MELGYKHPVGPLRTTDIVGLDVRLAIADHLAREVGDRFAPPSILREKVARGTSAGSQARASTPGEVVAAHPRWIRDGWEKDLRVHIKNRPRPSVLFAGQSRFDSVGLTVSWGRQGATPTDGWAAAKRASRRAPGLSLAGHRASRKRLVAAYEPDRRCSPALAGVVALLPPPLRREVSLRRSRAPTHGAGEGRAR